MRINILPEYELINPSDISEFYIFLSIEESYKAKEERSNIHTALIIDTSGSMAGKNINKVKEAVIYFINWLTRRDYIALISFNTNSEVVIPHTKLTDKPYISRLVKSIKAKGTTNLSGGLLLGYRELEKNLKEGDIYRIILFTDGMANEGITDKETLIKIASEYYNKGIILTTMGFGEEFDEELLLSLSKSGGGRYYYIKSIEEIANAFHEEFGNISAVIGQNLSLKVILPKELEAIECSLCDKYKFHKNLIEIIVGDLREGMDRAFFLKLKIKDKIQSDIILKTTISYLTIGNNGKIKEKSKTKEFTIKISEKEKSIENEAIKEKLWLYKSSLAKQRALELLDNGSTELAIEELNNILKEGERLSKKKKLIKNEISEIEHLINDIKVKGSLSPVYRKEISSKVKYRDEENVIKTTIYPDDLQALDEFIKTIEFELRLKGYPEDKIEDIKTVVTELVYNGIEHGCKTKQGEDGNVKVVATILSNSFKVIVEDSGKGFDYEKVLKETEDKKEQGIQKVRQLSDRLTYKGKGNIVEAVILKGDKQEEEEPFSFEDVEFWQDIAILHPKGELNFISIGALKKTIARLINEGWHKIIIDMQNISYIDSSGTGYLIKIQYELEKYDGELVLSNIRNSVAQILKLMKFDSFIKLIGDLESAKKYLSEKK